MGILCLQHYALCVVVHILFSILKALIVLRHRGCPMFSINFPFVRHCLICFNLFLNFMNFFSIDTWFTAASITILMH